MTSEPISAPRTEAIAQDIDRLSIELVELAFTLERQGRLDAADVALATSARLREIRDESHRPGAT